MTDNLEKWWQDWWAEDYSWDGLAKKQYIGLFIDENDELTNDIAKSLRDATLQDYWRDQERNLITCPVTGKRFTKVHAPLKWENGSDVQVFYQEQNEILKIKLADIEIAAQLQGAVLRSFNYRNLIADNKDGKYPINANFEDTIFLGYANFGSTTFSGYARFKNATFSGGANFGDTTFSGYANFDNATFLGSPWFDSATFSGYALFDNATFLGSPWFKNATFSGDANFKDTIFSGDAWFENATFSGVTWFDSATFSGDAWFENATFSWYAWFENATFLGIAWFQNAAFVDYLSIKNSIFLKEVDFSGKGVKTQNSENAQAIEIYKKDVSYKGVLKTDKSILPVAYRGFKKIDATGAVFLCDAIFDNRDIYEPSKFDNCIFLQKASFHGSDLHQGTSFHNASFDKALEPENWQKNANDIANNILDEAIKNYKIEIQDKKATKEKIQEIINNKNNNLSQEKIEELENHGQEIEDAIKTLEEFIYQIKNHSQVLLDNKNYFAELEDRFRTLKQAMEDNRNRQEEARFFKLELQARRKRNDGAIGWGEKWQSQIYGSISDYGHSVASPLVCIIIFCVFFAFLYSYIGVLCFHNISWNYFSDAIMHSFSRIPIFGNLLDKPNACSLIGQLYSMEGCKIAPEWVLTYPNGTKLIVFVLTGLQNIINIILLFLSGLALRRRFQMG